jgi:hypothetical protein
VEASLLANAICQSHQYRICRRFREQARSHKGAVVCFSEIVENNIHDLSKRDIKPLQIVVLSQF